MLDPHAETTERTIIGFFFFGQFLFLRFLERNVDIGMIFLKSLIAAIGIDSGLFGQRRSASPDLQIMHPARRRVRDTDQPSSFGDDDLGFDGMALFLTRIPASLLALRPFNRLFGAVDNQRLGLFAAHLDVLANAQHPRRQLADTRQRPADGRFVDAIEQPEKLLRHCAAI